MDFFALYRCIPARNLSGSLHSIIFVFPGGKDLELLKTTIPSAELIVFMSNLSHGYSTILNKLSEKIPLLNTNKSNNDEYINLILFLIIKNNISIKINPKGEKINGNNLLSKYVIKI